MSMSENRRKLKEAEDDLLNKLATAEGNLLENEPLILTLEETKIKSIEIADAIEKGMKTSAEIETAR